MTGIIPFIQPETRSIAYIKESCKRLELTVDEITTIIDPQETRIFRLPCNIMGQTVVFSGVVCLHNNSRGPYKGGIRIDSSVDLCETVELARVMTLKTAVTNIEFGGGKTGIKIDWPYIYAICRKRPRDKGFEKMVARSIIESYAQTYRDLFAKHIYIPAPDMGTGTNEMALIYNETSDPASVTGKPEGTHGWLPGRRESTGYGCAWATKLSVQRLLGVDASKVGVAIQGFGNVGSHLAKYLQEAGFRIVAVSDINGGIYNPEGFDINRIMEHAAKTGTVVGYPGESISNETLLSLPVDVLIPAASGHVIHVEQAKNVQAKLIIEAANVPITLEGMEVLKQKGISVIPDIIANAGGVIASMEEYSRSLSALKTKKEDTFRVVEEKIENALEESWNISEKRNIDLCRAAVELAVSRVYMSMVNRHQI